MEALEWAEEGREGGVGGVWVEGVLAGEANEREALLGRFTPGESAQGVESQCSLLAYMKGCLCAFLKWLGTALANLLRARTRKGKLTDCWEKSSIISKVSG